MTKERALKLCKDWFYSGVGELDGIAANIAINALEKQIPKKTLCLGRKVYFEDFHCPNCETFVQDDRDIHLTGAYDYCPWCGQALDWSENIES